MTAPRVYHFPRNTLPDHLLVAETAKMTKHQAALSKAFTATLQKSSRKGGWTYVVWPDSVEFFETRGWSKYEAK
jgi:hypothetical protein